MKVQVRARERRRDEFRMAYPAHHRTCSDWGEAIWTAPDLLLAVSPYLRLARSLALGASAGLSVSDFAR